MCTSYTLIFILALAAAYIARYVPLPVLITHLLEYIAWIAVVSISAFILWFVYFSPASDRAADRVYRFFTGEAKRPW